MKISIRFLVLLLLGAACQPVTAGALFARTNLVAWCIVPFDAKQRGPEERPQMLNRLGLQKMAYDWREEHIPTFDAEVEACKAGGIEITAWWFPGALDATAQTILQVIERHGIRPQLWISGGGGAVQTEAEQRQRVLAEAARIRPIAEAAARLGCRVALYNHGGWFGEPENQIAIIGELGMENVGIVYNMHHGHHHIDRFPEMFRTMQPYLLAFNLNGMIKEGDVKGRKIMTIGAGDQELAMLKVIWESGWQGPIGILDHLVETDSEQTLRENLKGLEKLTSQLDCPLQPD